MHHSFPPSHTLPRQSTPIPPDRPNPPPPLQHPAQIELKESNPTPAPQPSIPPPCTQAPPTATHHPPGRPAPPAYLQPPPGSPGGPAYIQPPPGNAGVPDCIQPPPGNAGGPACIHPTRPAPKPFHSNMLPQFTTRQKQDKKGPKPDEKGRKREKKERKRSQKEPKRTPNPQSSPGPPLKPTTPRRPASPLRALRVSVVYPLPPPAISRGGRRAVSTGCGKARPRARRLPGHSGCAPPRHPNGFHWTCGTRGCPGAQAP